MGERSHPLNLTGVESDGLGWLELQENIAFCVTKGFAIDWLLELDLASFDALTSTVLRMVYAERMEESWSRMIAAQATSKKMKGFLEPYREFVKRHNFRNRPKDGKALSALLKRLGPSAPGQRGPRGNTGRDLRPDPDGKRARANGSAKAGNV